VDNDLIFTFKSVQETSQLDCES